MRERATAKGRLWPATLLVLTACALHIHQLMGERTFIRDTYRFYAPAKHYLAELLRGNELPQWWPWDGLGSPFLAQPMFSVFHPTTLFYRMLPFWTAFAAQDFTATLLALTGTYLLARALGHAKSSALLAAVIFASCGYMVGLTEHTFAKLSAGTMPWYLWAILKGVRNGGKWLAAPGIALGLLLLAGDPQAAILSSIAGLALALAEQTSVRAAAIAIISPAIAAVLAAVQLVPSLMLIRETERAAGAPGIDQWPLDQLHLVGMIVAIPNDGFVFHMDLGLAVLALAAAAMVTFRSNRKIQVIVALAVLSIWLSLGAGYGLSEVFRAVVPVWSKLRYPIKSVVLAMLMIGLLAGEGLQQTGMADRTRARRLASFASFGCIAFVFAVFPMEVINHLGWGALFVPGVVGTVLALVLPSRTLAAAVVAFPMIYGAIHNLPTVKPAFYDPSPIVQSLRSQGVGLFGPAFDRLDDHHLDTETAPFYDTVSGGGANSLYSAMFDLPVLANYMPGSSQRLKRSWDSKVGPPEFARVAGVYGVGYMVLASYMADHHAFGAAADYAIVKEPNFGYTGFHLKDSTPRAYAVRRARVVTSPEKAGAIIRSDSFHPGHEVLIEGASPRTDWENRPADAVIAATISSRTDTSVVIDADLPWDGFIVLNEAQFEGWTATLDGKPAPTLIANGVVRAVEAPAGHHRVEWRFQTRGLKAGMIASIAGWIACAIALVLL